MVTVYKKSATQKRYTKIKSFRKYGNAYSYIAEQLMELDYRLHWGYCVDHLCEGYTKRRVFPFGSTVIRRKGVDFKIKI